MPVTLEHEPDRSHVAHLQLAFGELNLLTPATMDQLADAIAGVPDEVAVLSITGGPDTRGLTAGLDLSVARDFDAHQGLAMFDRLYAALEAVRNLEAVTICGCGEYALGAGLELAMACDVRIATLDATLGLPEVDVGLPTVIHGGLLLDQIGETRAKELIFTGESISGERAASIGLVTDAVAAPGYEDALGARVEQLAEKQPAVLRRQKRVFREWRSAGRERGIRTSRWLGALSFGTDEQRAAMTAFLDRED